MIRRLHISDLASLAMRGGIDGSDQVQNLKIMGKDERSHSITARLLLELLKEPLSTRNRRCTWVSIEHRHICGLVSAHMRSGFRTWEIDHVFHDTRRDDVILELVENVTADLGQYGAMRVFLRLTEVNPLVRNVSQSGFLVYQEETLHHSAIVRQSISKEALAGLRARLPQDDHSLFRLYSSSVPARLRALSGLTNEEWRDSCERSGKASVELVYEKDSTLLAWLKFLDQGTSILGEMLVHPEYMGLITKLVDKSTQIWKDKESISWLTAEHQPNLSRELRQRGFHTVRNYILMVNPLVQLVKEPSLASVQA